MPGLLARAARAGLIGGATLVAAGCLGDTGDVPAENVTSEALATDTRELVSRVRAELQFLKDKIDEGKSQNTLGLVLEEVTLNLSVATQKTKSGKFSLTTTVGELTASGGIGGKTDDTLTKTFEIKFKPENESIVFFMFDREKGAPPKDDEEQFVLANALLAVREGTLMGLRAQGLELETTCLTSTVEFKAAATQSGDVGLNLLIVSFGASTGRTDTGTHSITVVYGKKDESSC